jgi:3-oxoacyl-(acyl-carrier-protein) synthase
MSLALADAGCTPAEVDLVVADGAGVPELDRLEADALNRVFGERAVPVCAPSALTGRLCSGGAALNVATALLAMRDGVAPAAGYQADAAYGLDLVCGAPRELPIRVALVCARGQGGFNSALVLRGAP